MKKILTWATDLSVVGTVVLSVWYRETSIGILLSLAITFGTIAYHIVMRLLTGLVFRSVMQNRADYRKR